MFILKGDKVPCFDAVLEVLILKMVTGSVHLQESNGPGPDDSEGVKRTAWLTGMVRRVAEESRRLNAISIAHWYFLSSIITSALDSVG